MPHNPADPVNDEVTYIDAELHQPVGPTSRAGRLAMELATEKKRLMDELKEVQAENDDLKSTTPTGTVDWYVKWIASAFILASMTMRGKEHLVDWDIGLSLIGVTGWFIVGFLWNDRALILLNGAGIVFFLTTIVGKVFG